MCIVSRRFLSIDGHPVLSRREGEEEGRRGGRSEEIELRQGDSFDSYFSYSSKYYTTNQGVVVL
jgi:hypothetical protein